MRSVIAGLVLLVTAPLAFAQQQSEFVVAGRVIDDEGKSIGGAVVLLKADSLYVDGVPSHLDGQFVDDPGEYVLEVLFVGYERLYHPVHIDAPYLNVGDLGLTAPGCEELVPE